MADALKFVSLYIIVLGFWSYLGVSISLSLLNLRERSTPSIRPGQLPEAGWPDVNCFLPWRLWW